MIQRIQSLYLLIAAALAAVTLFVPLALFADNGSEVVMTAFALRDSEGTVVQTTIYMGILLSLSALLPLVTIFLFRRRMLQVRLCIVGIVVLLGSLVMTGIYCYLGMSAVASQPFGAGNLRPALALPLVAIIFMLLAARAIFKDELLVRSLDRIR